MTPDWSWPQIIMASFLGLQGVVAVFANGVKRPPINGPFLLTESALWAFVLGWGGFWK